MVYMFTAEELQLLDSAAEEEEDEACPICLAGVQDVNFGDGCPEMGSSSMSKTRHSRRAYWYKRRLN